jgi:copper chaperone CopZ
MIGGMTVVTNTSTTAVLHVGGLHYASEKAVVEDVLGRRPGVIAVEANPVAQTATVTCDPDRTSVEELSRWVEECGYHCDRRPGGITRTYNPHYNPFVYFDSVRNYRADSSKVVGFGSLHRDLARGRLPRFTWIAPGVKHDGHNGSLRRSDRYASRLVPRVLHALGPHGVLYLTWDEGARKDASGVGGAPGGGKVALIAAGGAARKGATTAAPANHYALLRTIEANFRLPALGHAGAPTTPLLSGLLKP